MDVFQPPCKAIENRRKSKRNVACRSAAEGKIGEVRGYHLNACDGYSAVLRRTIS